MKKRELVRTANDVALDDERKRLSCSMRQARATLLLYQEIQRAREDDMVGILQSSLFDGTPRVADSAGAATAANDLPAQWKEARRQTQLCKARFERLKYRYEPELVKYLRNARASREAFDQTFCRDRAQATRDWLQADNRCRSLQRRLREAQLARLSDLTSNFGSIPGTDTPRQWARSSSNSAIGDVV